MVFVCLGAALCKDELHDRVADAGVFPLRSIVQSADAPGFWLVTEPDGSNELFIDRQMAAEQEVLVKNIGWLENAAERTAIPSSCEGLHASFPQVTSQLIS